MAVRHCYGSNVSPPKRYIEVLTPSTSEYDLTLGNRVTADIICSDEVTPEYRVAPRAMMRVLKQRCLCGNTEPHVCVTTEADIGARQLQAKGCLRLTS